MFPVGPTSCASSNCLEHKIWGYKPNYLERGRKQRQRIYCHQQLLDINLITSRGDGNPIRGSWKTRLMSDINLITSRGDGNPSYNFSNSFFFGYKPNYLERGRKRVLRICVHFLPMMDINLITSRGDGNQSTI